MKRDNYFFWGGSISAHQSEGAYDKDGKKLNIMDLVTSGKVNKPREFHYVINDNYVYPSHSGIDFYNKYKEDIKLFKDAGFTALRFSIDWSRIFPNGDDEFPNKKGLGFYRSLIEELLNNGIEPIVTLYHFELPLNIVKKYGSRMSKRTIILYLKYCETVFREYKDHVTYWCTFNEMNHLDTDIQMSDFFSYMNTGLIYSKLKNPREVLSNCSYNMTVASVRAINLAHSINSKFKMGCVFGFTPSYAFSSKPMDSILAFKNMDIDMYQIDAMTKGEFPQRKINEYKKMGLNVDIREEEKQYFSQCKLDFIGINYYSSSVSSFEEVPEGNSSFFGAIENQYLEKSEWGWTIDPEGLRYLLLILDRRYNLPILITENGLGAHDELNADNEIKDSYRIEYLKKHIEQVIISLEEDSVNCFGYLMWGPIDLVSATTGEMKKRYGLIYIDKNDDGSGSYERIKKDSFYWFKEYIKNCNIRGNHGI